MARSLSLSGLKRPNKRSFAEITHETDDCSNKNADKGKEGLTKSRAIDEIVEAIKAIRSKEALKKYCFVDLIAIIEEKRGREYQMNRIKQQVEWLKSQLDIKKQETKSLSATLKEIKAGLQREIERKTIQGIILKRINVIRQNSIETQYQAIQP